MGSIPICWQILLLSTIGEFPFQHASKAELWCVFFSLNRLSNQRLICQWLEMSRCSRDFTVVKTLLNTSWMRALTTPFSDITHLVHNLLDVNGKVIDVSPGHICNFTLVAETDAGPSPQKLIKDVLTGQNRKCWLNILILWQKGHQFVDSIFKFIFVFEYWNLFPTVCSTLIRLMARRHTG